MYSYNVLRNVYIVYTILFTNAINFIMLHMYRGQKKKHLNFNTIF